MAGAELSTNRQCAFVLKMFPDKPDVLNDALAKGYIAIGWPAAEGLLDEKLDWQSFRKIVHDTYYPDDKDHGRAGNATGHLWRFLKDMRIGDLVVVPSGPSFHVCKITGEPIYSKNLAQPDTAYRRAVQWLNKEPIPRRLARADLRMRMGSYGTCTNASDLVPDVREVLELSDRGSHPTFESDLKKKLEATTKEELQQGRLDDYQFEGVVETVLRALGAEEAHMIARNKDKGADLVANFRIAGNFVVPVAVQVKHFRDEPPVSEKVVDDLIRGMETEGTDYGLIVTSGRVSPETVLHAESRMEEKGCYIAFIDGQDLASKIVDLGLNELSLYRPKV